LLYTSFDASKLSLEDLAESFTREQGLEISKQAIDKRFNEATVAFFKLLIEKAMQEISISETGLNFLKEFNRVRIKDSTCFQLPVEMADAYPGSGGAASKACIRIQFEYDIKTGQVIDLSLHSFIDQDLKNAIDTIQNICFNDLFIRDLGYISTEALREIKKKLAFFINRLISQVKVYTKDSKDSKEFEDSKDSYTELNFPQLLARMKKNNLTSLEKIVYITDKKEEVRLIIELLPQKIIQERIKKANKEAKKKKRTLTKEYKLRACFNLFITNISQEILSSEQIHYCYTLRWQIELVFKIWKSIGNIHKIKKMKTCRFESLLYAKLLWILINWTIVWQMNKYIYQTKNKLLSFYKVYKSLKKMLVEFKNALQKGLESLENFIEIQIQISSKYHLLEKKKIKNIEQNTLYRIFDIK